jgi:hypothetical protein
MYIYCFAIYFRPLARRSLQTNVVNLSVKYRFVIAKAKPEAIHSVCFSWIASLRSQ